MPAQHRTVDADASVNAGAASTDVRSPKNVAAALQQTLTLLSARDDTSRFVGLALVKSLLDNHETLRNESGTVAKCWDAVPAIFLDRLLRANAVAAGKAAKADVNATEIETADGDQHAKAKSAGEAKNMVDLAVGVIHSFALLLSGSSGHDKKLVERTPSLMAVLGRRLVGWNLFFCFHISVPVSMRDSGVGSRHLVQDSQSIRIKVHKSQLSPQSFIRYPHADPADAYQLPKRWIGRQPMSGPSRP